jgi:hypothetical protein
LEQYGTLVMQYLHQRPAEDIPTFLVQAAAALWAEERFFKNMASIFGGKK